MKQTLLTGFLSLSVLAILTGCSEENLFQGGDRGTGRISPTVGLTPEAITSRASSDLLSGYSASDLQLKLIPADGSTPLSWDSVDDFDPDQEFKVGEYTLEASRGSVEIEGFEQPAFYGSATLKVRENEVTSVSLDAKLVNSMVTVVFTDAFSKYMTDYSAELHADEGQYLAYAKDETRPVFLRPGNTLLNVTVTKPNGTTATIQAAHFTTKPQYHYTVTVDVNGGEVGGAETLTITFDENLDEETVEIDLSDDLINAAMPVVTPNGFNSGESIDFVPGMQPAGPFKIDIVARGKLGSVKMNTLSPSLIAQGWPTEVDLIGASSATQAKLQELGFKCMGLWRNPDQMAVIDMSGVLANISTVSGDNANVFTFTVTDKFNKSAEPVILAFNAENLAVEIAEISQLNVGDNEMTVDVLYNGVDVEKNVSILTPNDRGTWSKVVVKSVENLGPSRYMTTYRFTIIVPQSETAFQIKAVAGGAFETTPVTVTPFRLTYGIEMDMRDVYAHSAAITATATDGNELTYASDYELRLSTDGGSSYTAWPKTVDGTTMKIEGLQAGTTYKARLFNPEGKASNVLTFTTEAAAQLPNSSFDDWYTVNGKTSNWWVEYPGADTNAAWGTLNLLTTSAGGTGTSSSNATGAACAAFSGTRATDDGYQGRGAVIETVGWGSGNLPQRRALFITNAAVCQNFTAGELYLGSYDTSAKAPVYGRAYTSRPASMSFYYKYNAFNEADYGHAEVTIYDAAGNVLASASQQLTAADEYTKVTFDLEYASKEKAAKIDVRFKSSDNSACLPQSFNASYMTQPALNNYSDGRFTGSSLYVDEIELAF